MKYWDSNHVRKLYLLTLILIGGIFTATSQAQTKAAGRPRAAAVPEVEWYAPEIEKSSLQDRSRVIVTGKTQPGSNVQIDGDSITVIKDGGRGMSTAKIRNAWGRANFEGFFEIALELPQGLAQIPVLITTAKNVEKTFLISVDVKISPKTNDTVKLTNNKVSTSKPPAAAKKIRIWSGLGFTYQSYNQTTTGAADLNFTTLQAPGIVARGGYWGERWGLDFYFRDAPGKIVAAAPLKIQSDTYHWQTLEAKGLYQFERGPNSRLWGLPSQWQLRFGAQQHQIPFFDIDASNNVNIRDHSLTTATLGIGLLLAQEQSWSYEFAVGLQQPISSGASQGTYTLASPFAYEAQIGAAYKFAPNWRLGIFSYTQSLSHTYELEETGIPIKSGKQGLFYTTFDLRLGYEF